MSDEITHGSMKLFHPRGPQVTLPVLFDGDYRKSFLAVAAALDAGFLAVAPGLEPGEEKEQVGWVVRGSFERDGETTPYLLLYSADDNKSYSILKVYLNKPEDVAAFEFASGMKLDRIPKGVRAYAIRHMFVTQALVSGLDLATVAQLAGHSDIHTTHAYYAHLEDEEGHMADAADKAVRTRTRSVSPEEREKRLDRKLDDLMAKINEANLTNGKPETPAGPGKPTPPAAADNSNAAGENQWPGDL